MEIDIYIDSLTECLLCAETGKMYDTEYCLVSRKITGEEAQLLMVEGWKFDWSIPQQNGYEIYELF